MPQAQTWTDYEILMNYFQDYSRVIACAGFCGTPPCSDLNHVFDIINTVEWGNIVEHVIDRDSSDTLVL